MVGEQTDCICFSWVKHLDMLYENIPLRRSGWPHALSLTARTEAMALCLPGGAGEDTTSSTGIIWNRGGPVSWCSANFVQCTCRFKSKGSYQIWRCLSHWIDWQGLLQQMPYLVVRFGSSRVEKETVQLSPFFVWLFCESQAGIRWSLLS
jgi:hypothetical protein